MSVSLSCSRVAQLCLTAAVAQSVKAVASHVESWVFESPPRQPLSCKNSQ